MPEGLFCAVDTIKDGNPMVEAWCVIEGTSLCEKHALPFIIGRGNQFQIADVLWNLSKDQNLSWKAKPGLAIRYP